MLCVARWSPLVVAALASAQEAGPEVLRVFSGEASLGCIERAALKRRVEAQLGPEVLDDVPGQKRLEVTVERRAHATLRLLDAAGDVEGVRVLDAGSDCGELERQLALVVSLWVDAAFVQAGRTPPRRPFQGVAQAPDERPRWGVGALLGVGVQAGKLPGTGAGAVGELLLSHASAAPLALSLRLGGARSVSTTAQGFWGMAGSAALGACFGLPTFGVVASAVCGHAGVEVASFRRELERHTHEAPLAVLTLRTGRQEGRFRWGLVVGFEAQFLRAALAPQNEAPAFVQWPLAAWLALEVGYLSAIQTQP